MKYHKEDNRHMVEYVDTKGRVVYADAERFVDEDDKFEDKIPKSRQTKDKEKMKGLEGFKRMSKTNKEKVLEEKIK